MRSAYPLTGVQLRSVGAAQLRGVALAVRDISLDVLVEAAGLHGIRPDLGRDTEGHGHGRDLGVVGHHRARADQGTAAYDGPVQHDRVGADEAVVLDGAALQVGEVTNDTPVAYPR